MTELSVPVGAQDHVQGYADAACTLVEYGDFQCPSCRLAYPAVRHVQKHFGERLRFVYRHYPLPQHPLAGPAAETAEFAAKHGKFWAMHDALFERQPELSEQLFGNLAERLGLDTKELGEALDEGEFTPRVEADVKSGDASGVMGTPTFFINGVRHEGGAGATALIEAIEETLSNWNRG